MQIAHLNVLLLTNNFDLFQNYSSVFDFDVWYLQTWLATNFSSGGIFFNNYDIIRKDHCCGRGGGVKYKTINLNRSYESFKYSVYVPYMYICIYTVLLH